MTAPGGWTPGRGWGWVWGDDDEVGALNALSPESVLAALGGVEQGRVFDLGVTLDRDSFLWSGHVGTEVVMFRSPDGLLRFGDLGLDDPEGVSFHTSMVVISDHADWTGLTATIAATALIRDATELELALEVRRCRDGNRASGTRERSRTSDHRGRCFRSAHQLVRRCGCVACTDRQRFVRRRRTAAERKGPGGKRDDRRFVAE